MPRIRRRALAYSNSSTSRARANNRSKTRAGSTVCLPLFRRQRGELVRPGIADGELVDAEVVADESQGERVRFDRDLVHFMAETIGPRRCESSVHAIREAGIGVGPLNSPNEAF